MALVLTRRIGETLKIGDDVNVTVLGVKGNQVRIAVDAPSDVAVHRQEIWEKIQLEKGVPPEQVYSESRKLAEFLEPKIRHEANGNNSDWTPEKQQDFNQPMKRRKPKVYYKPPRREKLY